MIYIAITYDDVGMVSINARNVAEYARREQVFEMGGRIEVWNKDKRQTTFETMDEFRKSFRSQSGDDEDDRTSKTFW
ncbi:hypothetical protein [Paenibacillus sinopodophylli]|uniref:hypothetical protein n=1 Tax=Paenibacillus sinopodophylli TaxID=1837342 RepID=UPI00110D1F4B|nr:hypothetical protein [Paenibacillus sinopodophylli]